MAFNPAKDAILWQEAGPPAIALQNGIAYCERKYNPKDSEGNIIRKLRVVSVETTEANKQALSEFSVVEASPYVYADSLYLIHLG